jgi:hypothetical protein
MFLYFDCFVYSHSPRALLGTYLGTVCKDFGRNIQPTLRDLYDVLKAFAIMIRLILTATDQETGPSYAGDKAC